MSDNGSLKSNASKPKTPSAEGGKKVGFGRPTLIIPPPQMNQRGFTPHSASVRSNMTHTMTPGSIGPSHDMYGRKASMFVFDQLNGIKSFTMNTAKSGMGVGEKCSYWMYGHIRSLSKKWFTHFFLTFVLVLYTIGGALMFSTIEGSFEEEIKSKNMRKERYNLIRELRNLSLEMPHRTSDGEWEGEAARKFLVYEELVVAFHKNYTLLLSSEGKVWTLWNAVVYCATIYTTIGYGHLYPTTNTGRALTIVYSIIGIPLFLIALTDFGKLFTRGIKFLWSFVRRLYYTGSCRNVRKTAHVQEIFKGAQMMYEIATFRRPSMMVHDAQLAEEGVTGPDQKTEVPPPSLISGDDTPTTPNVSVFEIDDEFNLPITVALFILISYIFIGAVIYCMWEEWNFFASFYFVFISMSTIGFGDIVPKKPLCMFVTIVYLVFGLALMSMCINVVQEKLTDTFKQASAKLSATIGFEAEDDGSLNTAENVEIPGVHVPRSPGNSLTVPSAKTSPSGNTPTPQHSGANTPLRPPTPSKGGSALKPPTPPTPSRLTPSQSVLQKGANEKKSS